MPEVRSKSSCSSSWEGVSALERAACGRCRTLMFAFGKRPTLPLYCEVCRAYYRAKSKGRTR